VDTRYAQHEVSQVFDLPWTYSTWWAIERELVTVQRRLGLVDTNETDQLVDVAQPAFTARSEGLIRQILEEERVVQHDVAAFLAVVRQWWGEPHARWIHFGLTSSDLVDTAMALRFQTLNPVLERAINDLVGTVGVWTRLQTPLLGRTHGQPAEPTTVGVRASNWMAHFGPAVTDLIVAGNGMLHAKLSGPIGTYAHNSVQVERMTAEALGLAPFGAGASQVVPRIHLASWADAAARFLGVLDKVATDLRLMNILGEVNELRTGEQVGSSAMPHKENPIGLEQVSGMARLAAGYAGMLRHTSLWLERDISHSCVERVAVPDLWHVLLYSIRRMTDLMGGKVQVDPVGCMENLDSAGVAPYTSKLTLSAIRRGMTVSEARRWAMTTNAADTVNVDADAGWFVRQTPKYGDTR
jgi:adenylosuccinate lyase